MLGYGCDMCDTLRVMGVIHVTCIGVWVEHVSHILRHGYDMRYRYWGGGGVTTSKKVDKSVMGPRTVTRSSLRMLHRVAVFCRPLRPVLLLVSFPHSRSPVVGVPGLCWMWRDVPFARQRRPIVGVLGVVLVVAGVV